MEKTPQNKEKVSEISVNICHIQTNFDLNLLERHIIADQDLYL